MIRVMYLFLSFLLVACSTPRPSTPIWVGGLPVLDLDLPQSQWSDEGVQIRRIQLIPGRGLNTHQIWAHVPGKGEVAILASDPIEQVAPQFSAADHDVHGNQSFFQGGPWMIPFANRIRGSQIPAKNQIRVQAGSKAWSLDANWAGSKPGSEPHAMHGLLLKTPFDVVTNTVLPDGSRQLRAEKRMGDFGGRWIGDLNLVFEAVLKKNSIVFRWQAINMGTSRVPVGMGWHPFFRIPSGDRAGAVLEIPAERRAQINNYNDVFPTGRLVRVEGSDFDFRKPRPLGNTFLDDSFTSLVRNANREVVVSLADPKSGLRTHVMSRSQSTVAIQVYAPVDKPFVAIEPQTQLADPFSKSWGRQPTGMRWLKPGQKMDFEVEVKVEALGG